MSRLTKSAPWLLALLLFVPAPAAAVRVEGLYRAEVEVVDKGAEARAEGFRAALEQVLVRVTGSTAVLANAELETVLEAPARYVVQYRYEEIERDPEAEAAAAAEEAEAAGEGGDGAAGEAEPLPQYRLQVVFGQRRIDRLLEAREIAVWDVYRPQVLVWLAFDDGRRRTLVAADDDSEIDEALRTVAERRGLPLLLPLLDMQDQRRIEYLDIQGGFLERVREASERYNASLVLTGHVYRQGDSWRGEWTLLEPEGRRGWLTRADDAAETVHAGIGGLAERLAEQLAGRQGEQRDVRIRVEDAVALDDYARLERYFSRLPRVERHRIVRVRPKEILFELSLRGQLSELERSIALDNLLEPVQGEVESSSPGVSVLTTVPAPASDGGRRDPAGGPALLSGSVEDPVDGDAPNDRADLIYRLAG